MSELFRHIPSVDASLSALEQADPAFVRGVPRTVLRDAVTQFWDELRAQIRTGAYTAPDQLALARHLPFLLKHVRRFSRPRFSSVINGTGVIVHTNMGRSPLAAEARQAVLTAAEGYCNVELDMQTGGRGSRHALTEGLLCRLTGAEAALVVNNNFSGSGQSVRWRRSGGFPRGAGGDRRQFPHSRCHEKERGDIA